MSLPDPLSITVSGTTSSLPRTSSGDNKAEYRSADGLMKFTASHSYGRRARRVLRLDHSKVGASLLVPSQNEVFSTSVYLVMDHPTFGYTAAELLAIEEGFDALLDANTNQLVTKMLGGES
ncbi:TPA_asm: coat protein [ssRNA phage Gerhypos.2_31]|uniref:Coat protein n=2 Tax=Leviviricetes TaxID=2842243 RepID=A0A8S5KXK7_9VIRU|nr:coat protein [ssRNA phage Gerhypos.2_31]QDH89885.1 MAG: hypothetical protein H2Bulk36108_000002 [Leviviridae sp.]DAD50097.1 TPA_asm: coat protein [ssRNA phage Gerhypos.2_31]